MKAWDGPKVQSRLIIAAETYYASVSSGDQRIPCTAHARGGDTDVECQVETAGELTIYENNWNGWSVSRDGRAAVLLDGNWLSTAAPAGSHTYQFRYHPCDVPVGLALTAAGWGVALGLWFKAKPDAAAPAGQSPAG